VLAPVSDCLYVSGTRAVVRFFGDRSELPIPDRFVAVIVCDGAILIQAEAVLMEGLEDESLYATTISRNFPALKVGSHLSGADAVEVLNDLMGHCGIPNSILALGQYR